MTSVVALIARTATALDAITRWWPLTADPPRTEHHQGHRPAGPRLPASAEVLSLRRAVVDELASLALEVAEDQDLRPGIDTRDVVATASWLRLHHEWIATSSADPEHTVATLEHHARRLEQTARGLRAAHVTLGPCPVELPDGHCPGVASATVRSRDDLLPSTITCTADPTHEWSPWEWDRLGRQITIARHGRDWLPVADVAAITHIPAGTIRRWIATGTVDRRGGRPGLVSVAAVDATRRRMGERTSA